LPGTRDGFEMYQRLRPGETDNPFTQEDLDALLQAQDIPARFRGWLTQIAYRTLSRVDVRRMYRLGVLDEEGVYQAYLDLGYNQDDAAKMTEFTVKFETSEERDITRSAVQTGYETGLLTRQEALNHLTGIGYNQNIAQFWLDLVDWELENDKRKNQLDYIEDLYLNGQIDEGELMGELGALDMPSDRMQRIYDQLYLKRRNKIKLPSKTELDRWLKMGVVDEGFFVDGHLALGYRQEDAERYLFESLTERQEDAAEAAADAQEEQERVYEASLRSEYQISTADINQEIAQAKLAIADIKLAIAEGVDDKTAQELKTRVVKIKRYIAALREQKARLRLEFEQELAPEE